MKKGNSYLLGSFLFLLVALGLTQCGGEGSGGGAFSVGSEGGSVSFENPADPAVTVTLTFPPGAVSDGTEIVVAQATDFPASSDLVPNTAFAFGPGGTFGVPVTLTITYNPDNLGGLTASELALHTVVNGAWQAVASTLDGGANAVSAQINGFSTWGILEVVAVDSDGDGSPDAQDCAPGDPDISPGAAELCDSVDNDCDDQTDEDFPTLGQACDGPDSDLCQNGTLVCAGDGLGVVCGTESPADIAETCDGADNDCDGETDEGCECTPNATQPCGSNIGECSQGTQTCQSNGTWGACIGATGPTTEVCNGADDDCDTQTDEPGNSLCDDGLSCTTDVCNGAGGCSNAIQTDTCLISGVCYLEAEQHPGIACLGCISTTSQTAWSSQPDGASCSQIPGGNCCSLSCVDFEGDESNCGGCGNLCGASQVCSIGSCSCTVDADCDGIGGGSSYCCASNVCTPC